MGSTALGGSVAMRPFVRDGGVGYEEWLRELAGASGSRRRRGSRPPTPRRTANGRHSSCTRTQGEPVRSVASDPPKATRRGRCRVAIGLGESRFQLSPRVGHHGGYGLSAGGRAGSGAAGCPNAAGSGLPGHRSHPNIRESHSAIRASASHCDD